MNYTFEMTKRTNQPYTIEEMQVLAKSRKGKCLSKKYMGVYSTLKWKCDLGHVWSTKPKNILNGHWCHKCAIEATRNAKIKYSVLDMRVLAKARGGRCMSKKYMKFNHKLKWECSNKHQFLSTPSKVLQGNWCPLCIGRGKTIKTLRELAVSRGGLCLSPKYLGARENAHWECKNRHRWFASPDSVINKDSWCPQCTSGKGETLVRIFFEELFKCKFSKVRPDWLRNKEGNKLELDGYNEKLGIAFEHQGEFHYRKIRKYTVSDNEFKKRQETDQIKKSICKKKGITLIEVPEVGNMLQKAQLKAYILKELRDNKVKLPQNYKNVNPDYESLWTHQDNDRLAIARKHIESKKGKLHSKVFLGTSYKIKIECELGHIWEARYHNLLKGRWCPTCNGNPTITIRQMQELAKTNKGKCLSNTYINSQTHLVWQCNRGHTWGAIPSNVMRGNWCPVCNSGKMPNLVTLRKAKRQTIR